MRHLAGLVSALFVTLMLAVGAVAAAERAIIVLDASGSMWGQIDGTPKIAIARQTLASVLAGLPPDLELGLMAYGHREKGSCSDIELMIPPAAGTGPAIAKAAQKITPLGKTPLSEAVKEAAEALAYTEEKATVILITDGIETCDADPCALASDLEKSGVDFTAHVVGFGLSKDEGQQVACLAENTGGQYFDAEDADGLTKALTDAVSQVAETKVEPAPAPPPEPETFPSFNLIPDASLSEGGPSVGDEAGIAWEIYRANPDGSQGEYLDTGYGMDYRGQLDPGDYVLRARVGEASVTQPVTIEEGEVAEPFLVLDAGLLIIHPRANEGEPPNEGAAVVITYPSGEATAYGDTRIYLPAGDETVKVTIGAGEATETIALAPGETVERDIVLGVGHATVNAFYVPGMKVEDGGLAVEIVKAAKAIDGSQESIGYTYGPDTGFDLPPGDYVARLQMGEARVEVPFTITGGQLTEVEGVLDAGVAAVSAPGATSIEIVAAKKDIQGNRQSFAFGYDTTLQVTLPAGEYAAIASMADGSTKEGALTVTAGERAEVTVE